MASELEVIVQLLMSSAALIVAIITILVSFRLINFFKGSPFEKPWKILLLIPVFMGGIAICELLDINVLRVRATLALAASIVFLYCITIFYRTWKSIGKR